MSQQLRQLLIVSLRFVVTACVIVGKPNQELKTWLTNNKIRLEQLTAKILMEPDLLCT